MNKEFPGLDPDLVFTSSSEARRYVLSFGRKYMHGTKISYADTSDGRRIHFYNMSDEDAILVANMMRRDVEIPAFGKPRKGANDA